MERYITKQFEVAQTGQGVQFQVRLPRNCKTLTGIKVTTDFFIDDLSQCEMGRIWLGTPGLGDAFYSEAIRAEQPLHGYTSYGMDRLIQQFEPMLWGEGRKQEFFTMNLPVTETLIEGFYLNEQAVRNSYMITLYLKIEV